MRIKTFDSPRSLPGHTLDGGWASATLPLIHFTKHRPSSVAERPSRRVRRRALLVEETFRYELVRRVLRIWLECGLPEALSERGAPWRFIANAPGVRDHDRTLGYEPALIDVVLRSAARDTCISV